MKLIPVIIELIYEYNESSLIIIMRIIMRTNNNYAKIKLFIKKNEISNGMFKTK